MGKYNEHVLCNIILMDVGHIILGRPWHFDHNNIHDGQINKITFTHQGSNIILTPLTPNKLKMMKLN